MKFLQNCLFFFREKLDFTLNFTLVSLKKFSEKDLVSVNKKMTEDLHTFTNGINRQEFAIERGSFTPFVVWPVEILLYFKHRSKECANK